MKSRTSSFGSNFQRNLNMYKVLGLFELLFFSFGFHLLQSISLSLFHRWLQYCSSFSPQSRGNFHNGFFLDDDRTEGQQGVSLLSSSVRLNLLTNPSSDKMVFLFSILLTSCSKQLNFVYDVWWIHVICVFFRQWQLHLQVWFYLK